MLNESFDKEDEKLLREYADHLPVVMIETYEVHKMTGAELIEMGYVVMDGKEINPEKKYNYNAPVQIAANHYRRLKRAWIKDGEAGVSKYIHHIADLIKKNETVNA